MPQENNVQGVIVEGFAPLRERPEDFAPGIARARPEQRRRKPRSPEFQWLLEKVQGLVRAHPSIAPEDVWIRWLRCDGGNEIRLALEIQRPDRTAWRFQARVRAGQRERLARKLRLAAQDFRRRLLQAFPMGDTLIPAYAA